MHRKLYTPNPPTPQIPEISSELEGGIFSRKESLYDRFTLLVKFCKEEREMNPENIEMWVKKRI
jgi:hypothetical protein